MIRQESESSTGAVATRMKEWPLKSAARLRRLGGFLSGDFGAFAAGFRQTNRDRLFATLDPLAALTAFQRALFPFLHCTLYGFLGSLTVACHTHTSFRQRTV